MKLDIVIHSGMEGFVLIDRILESGPSHIVGRSAFHNAPLYRGLESLAQTGAYHVRFLTGFAKHAFLLKIGRCFLPPGRLEGEYLLRGDMTGRGESSFSYHLRMEQGDLTAMEGTFFFAAADYGPHLKRELLERHYRKVYACLQDDSKTG
jgi:hypothetical protein